jgi:microcompartment protein CcmK/EutM
MPQNDNLSLSNDCAGTDFFLSPAEKKSTLLFLQGGLFCIFGNHSYFPRPFAILIPNTGIFSRRGDKVMKCYEVTGMVSAEKRLSALDELSLITLRSSEGEGLVAADLLGVRPGDRVVVSTSGAQAVLGTNLPVDALVLCVLNRSPDSALC